ncbi:uncharacterized protein LOC108095118 [Drosophila ficusphila]|uniref:uncharacterized protein LOC108095118 n=1 Tax=Drosophila ficusphila TaxID=30025 RepID=UPI0007E6D69A|nr:uncharacterized protein LOC108095118 [Drosophila ficusphila]
MAKMNRRNKRTSYFQYEIYLDFMEDNPLMSANKLSRTQDGKKWKELSDQLNKCTTGPHLSPEDWRKRLNDWKHTTRSKYRRLLNSDDKNNFLTPLEKRALHIFSSEPTYREIPASERFQETVAENDELEEEEVEEEPEEEDDEQYHESVVPQETEPPVLINGRNSGKRIRLDSSGEVLYQVTTAPPQPTSKEAAESYGKQIEEQLKRLSDIHEATLHFKIARFKYNNPGFDYVPEI